MRVGPRQAVCPRWVRVPKRQHSVSAGTQPRSGLASPPLQPPPHLTQVSIVHGCPSVSSGGRRNGAQVDGQRCQPYVGLTATGRVRTGTASQSGLQAWGQRPLLLILLVEGRNAAGWERREAGSPSARAQALSPDSRPLPTRTDTRRSGPQVVTLSGLSSSCLPSRTSCLQRHAYVPKSEDSDRHGVGAQ